MRLDGLQHNAFLLTWTPSTIVSIAFWTGNYGYGYEITTATIEPLQGFWNLNRLISIFTCRCCKSPEDSAPVEQLEEAAPKLDLAVIQKIELSKLEEKIQIPK
jgi:hypothetical protein